MTDQKHTVTTDALATIGKIIDDSAGRDAIHLAVEPVTAGTVLHPGQDIGIRDGKAFPARPYLGIVDPFLTNNVQEGQRFWLIVYPRQITSLRHVWEHPAFPAATETPTLSVTDKDTSETWLRRYAAEIDESYDDLMDAARYRLDKGEWFYGTNDRGKFEGVSTHPHFWHHFQIVTGRVVPPDEQENFFTCSC